RIFGLLFALLVPFGDSRAFRRSYSDEMMSAEDLAVVYVSLTIARFIIHLQDIIETVYVGERDASSGYEASQQIQVPASNPEISSGWSHENPSLSEGDAFPMREVQFNSAPTTSTVYPARTKETTTAIPTTEP
ncbi:hypothetical protein PMAYCL1PPCAC_16945, partial [Pristionchus mayeri]